MSEVGEKCSVCGKSFPPGMDWCNWCEPAPADSRSQGKDPLVVAKAGAAPPPLTLPVIEVASKAAAGTESGFVAASFRFLLRAVAMILGLLMLAGGGISLLCGVMSLGHGGGSAAMLGLLILGIGAFATSATFRGDGLPQAPPAGRPEDETK